MASNVAHDKPETEEQPTVKKLRIDEDAASVESNASGEDKMESADEASPSEATTLTVDVTPSPSTETGTPHAATPKVASAANTPKPAASGFSAFSGGGFGSFASGSGFSSFAKPAESSGFSSGFGAFASAASDSSSGFSGFAKKAEGATGFGAFAQGDDSAEGFGESASADFDPNSDEATAEFTPVVSLTEAEVANGEEQERIVVEKRAKLFKLVGADYTEVGVGPFRVLQPRDVNDTEQAKATARMVMRRESYPRGPGTKLILNSRLTAFISSVPKSEKSLMVVILERESGQLEEGQADKSGDAVKPVTYLLRFSTHEDLVEVQKRVVELLPAHATTA